MQRRLNLWDGLAAGICLLVALAIWLIPLFRLRLSEDNAAQATVAISYRDGRAEEVYSLYENRSLTLVSGGYTLRVEIRDGKVSVAESNCPDGVCIRSGTISRPGETIVCAPAGISLRIQNAENEQEAVDAILG